MTARPLTLPALIAEQWSGTLQQLAEAVGVSQSSVWNWTQGTTAPRLQARNALAAALDVEPFAVEAAVLETMRARAGRNDAVLLEDAESLLTCVGNLNGRRVSQAFASDCRQLSAEIGERLAAQVEGTRR
jgi:transcriptional regulator with XRE-family HTH domain